MPSLQRLSAGKIHGMGKPADHPDNVPIGTCPECELPVYAWEQVTMVGDQPWHAECVRARGAYDEYVSSLADGDG